MKDGDTFAIVAKMMYEDINPKNVKRVQAQVFRSKAASRAAAERVEHEHQLHTEALQHQRENEPFGPAMAGKDYPEPQPMQEQSQQWVPNLTPFRNTIPRVMTRPGFVHVGNMINDQPALFVKLEVDMSKFADAMKELTENFSRAMQPIIDWSKEHESMLQQIAKAFDVPVDSLKPEVRCPHDTDGDGHCGRRGCAFCGGP